MNKTTNYQLNQWERTDKVQMEDFNADNAKIDAAIRAVDAKADTKAAQSALNALQTVVNGKGNCQIVTGSYVGTGEFGPDHPCTLTFDRRPMVIFLGTNTTWSHSTDPRYNILFRGGSHAVLGNMGRGSTVTWGERSVSWYASTIYGTEEDQINEAGKTYEYIAFLI